MDVEASGRVTSESRTARRSGSISNIAMGKLDDLRAAYKAAERLAQDAHTVLRAAVQKGLDEPDSKKRKVFFKHAAEAKKSLNRAHKELGKAYEKYWDAVLSGER